MSYFSWAEHPDDNEFVMLIIELSLCGNQKIKVVGKTYKSVQYYFRHLIKQTIIILQIIDSTTVSLTLFFVVLVSTGW